MHLLIILTVVGGVLTVSLPQYQPPMSLQHQYEVPPAGYPSPLDASRQVQSQRPMYTYAEVNTPYYQYHYYSPVYKTNRNLPQPFESSLPEQSIRNNVNSDAYGVSRTSKNSFYPATTTIPLFSPGSSVRNTDYTRRDESGIQLFSPIFVNTQEVAITTKPLRVNNVFTPMFKTYKAPVSNNVNPSPIAPVTTPTELASGFPNILRESYGNDRDPETPLIYQNITSELDQIVPTNVDSSIVFKSLAVPESLATPSSSIVKDEVRRRGISPQLLNRNQLSSDPNKPALDQSSLNTDTVTSTSLPNFSIPVEATSRTSLSYAGSGVIPANILRVFSSPKLDFVHNYTFNSSSAVVPADVALTEVSNEDATESYSQSTSPISSQTSTGTTVSHLQKIAKKMDQNVVSKKIPIKHPNVLFYSPGHDIPK